MKKPAHYLFIIFILILTRLSFVSMKNEVKKFPILRGPYLGQKAPVDTAIIFLDGIISRYEEPEMCAAFTLDGKEFYFNTLHKDSWAIFVTKEVNGKWTKPEPLKFESDYTDRDFTMSPDGAKIYFGSNRPREEGGEKLKSLDIFYIERTQSCDWSEPKNIGLPINTDFGENYPSVARNGNLYFFSCRDDGLGGCDIYVSRFVDGQYITPENLGSSINSEKNDWDAYIAPDESYIIFSSQDRDDSIGGQDLYISYRKKDGSWTQSKNMGRAVNSEFCEICPSATLDGKYLFFTSRRRGKADILWITTDIIAKLKQNESD